MIRIFISLIFTFHEVILNGLLLLLKFWLTSSDSTCFSRDCIIHTIRRLSYSFLILFSNWRFILNTLLFRHWLCFFFFLFFLFFFRAFDFFLFFFLFWFFYFFFYNFLFFNWFWLFLFFFLFLRFTTRLLNRSCLSLSFFFFFCLFLS